MIRPEYSNSVFSWTFNWACSQKKIKLYEKNEITSTNSFGKELPTSTIPQLIIAKTQTQGRGRGHNKWISPSPGSALLCSWIFDLNFSPQPILSPMVGLAVYKALMQIEDVSYISLKAPNDLYFKSSKIGGVLIELQSLGTNIRCIIGIGINVLNTPDLKNTESLAQSKKGPLTEKNWHCFLNTLFSELVYTIEYSKKSELSSEHRSQLLTVLNQHPEYHYLDILPDGSLKTRERIIPWHSL